MNRAKKASRLYEEAKPEIDANRARIKVAQRLYRSIRFDENYNIITPKGELMKMATMLKIKGRGNMTKDELADAIHDRTK